ncbi:hypothetical protein [Salinispora arenicola]|uniref:hypothetical protein n=1 Tax=Salinispora arenicola TaxID=168697 RepID=UPI0016B52A81|nr:hypothetical protein [Salinispora arenicola]NIL61431.1 hypothetical protein [Salinispora arenicola]
MLLFLTLMCPAEFLAPTQPMQRPIDSGGVTIDYKKTTVTPDGSIAHVKDKFNLPGGGLLMVSGDNSAAREARAAALRALIKLDMTPGAALTALAGYGWDSGEDLVMLTTTDLRRMLHRYLGGELTEDEWQLWAEALESRDDIGFDDETAEVIKEFIFQSATPEIFEPLSPLLARRWLSRLD